MAHYDGASWRITDFADLKGYNFLRIRRNNIQSEDYFIYAIKEDAIKGDIRTIFHLKIGGEPKIIYAGQGWTFIQEIGNEVYFVIDNTINKYVNNEFIPFLEIELPNFGAQIFGRNRKDIFFRMFDGIAHYNGIDIRYIYKFNRNTSITDGVIFDKDIFFLAIDRYNSNDYIIHGKLKQ